MELAASQQAATAALSGLDAGSALRAARSGRDEEAGKAFEELLARMLVRELRRALPEGPFGGGAGADVYEGWFDETLGAALVANDALGLSGMIKTSLARDAAARGPDGESA